MPQPLTPSMLTVSPCGLQYLVLAEHVRLSLGSADLQGGDQR